MKKGKNERKKRKNSQALRVGGGIGSTAFWLFFALWFCFTNSCSLELFSSWVIQLCHLRASQKKKVMSLWLLPLLFHLFLRRD